MTDLSDSSVRLPAAAPILAISGLSKTYAGGLTALRDIDLTIYRGEIFALLGPNGAGKTTLINIICGIVTASAGTVVADGTTSCATTAPPAAGSVWCRRSCTPTPSRRVWATVKFSRGLFGKPPNPGYCEKVLRDLSLWDKRDDKIMTLSGGMKRRVMIAKALSHEPTILFLDEPTAGVDVELRRDMWQMVRGLRDNGVTIILTTHYIEEAEEMADRIGVISKGELIVVEDKAVLMRKLGKKQLTLQLQQPLTQLPAGPVRISAGAVRRWPYAGLTPSTPKRGDAAFPTLLKTLSELNIEVKDLHSSESSLEDIFVEPGEGAHMNVHAIRAIYHFEMARTFRTLMQSIASPVLSTSLYFVVFGAAIGARMGDVDRRQLRRVHRARA